MDIEQFLYDLTESGDAIVAYTMTSESGAKVQLCNLGASVLSFTLAEGGADIMSGRCVRGIEGVLECGVNAKEPFDERLWESWVEYNRVMMATQIESDGVNVNIELVFDFDDDHTFEITYQAYSMGGDVELDLTHALKINLGDGMSSEIYGTHIGDGLYTIDGAKRSILSEVAKLQSSQRSMTVCSSQPHLYFNAQSEVLAPVSHPAAEQLKDGERYIQKNVFRLA